MPVPNNTVANPISYWCSFNGIQLNTVPNLQIYSINPYVPPRNLNIFAMARGSARKLASAFYQSRQIAVSLVINAGNQAALQQALDQLYAQIQAQEALLVISQSGTQRQYTATYSKTVDNNPNPGQSSTPAPQGGYTDITLLFECSDSFGYDTTYTTIIGSGSTPLANQSSATNRYPYTQGGGSDTQVPWIQIQFSAIGSAPVQGTVTVGNQQSGQAASVTRLWSATDLIQIDCNRKIFYVNGVDTSYSGAIPEFGLGSQVITYVDTFASRLFSILGYVYNRWN